MALLTFDARFAFRILVKFRRSRRTHPAQRAAKEFVPPSQYLPSWRAMGSMTRRCTSRYAAAPALTAALKPKIAWSFA